MILNAQLSCSRVPLVLVVLFQTVPLVLLHRKHSGDEHTAVGGDEKEQNGDSTISGNSLSIHKYQLGECWVYTSYTRLQL